MLKIILWLRALIFIPFVIIHTFYSSVIVIILLILRAPRAWVDFAIVNLWCNGIVFMAGLDVEVSGLENVPKEKGFLYLFTHSSHLDIPVLFNASPRSFRFGAKSSLFKIPVFGYAITLSGTLPITRENRDKVLEVYRNAEARVARGEAFALAPEGGRRKGSEILEFKSGPFLFAINAKMPLVPVVLCGIDLSLKKGSIWVNTDVWRRKVGVRFLPARDVSHCQVDDAKRLKEEVRQEILLAYADMKKKYMV